MRPDANGPATRDPVAARTVATLDEREELAAGFRLLPSRERLLLYLWYAEDRPVAAVATSLGISRAHCYRLRDRALVTLASGAGAPGSAA